ncbi:MAG TPA: hypothetical protein VNW68_06640 [Candidatus Limnocylindria bacterium]|nr:hypothetical protein [Candidatus Limnocylindria bacterium]
MPMAPILLAAATGAVAGLAADRLGAAWLGDGWRSRPGWQSVVLAAAGALVAGGLLARWPAAGELVLLGGLAALLLVLLATDLHSRLLPDVLTLPLIAAAGIGLFAGVERLFLGFVIASVAFALVLLLLLAVRRIGIRSAVPFGPVLIGAGWLAMLLR